MCKIENNSTYFLQESAWLPFSFTALIDLQLLSAKSNDISPDTNSSISKFDYIFELNIPYIQNIHYTVENPVTRNFQFLFISLKRSVFSHLILQSITISCI